MLSPSLLQILLLESLSANSYLVKKKLSRVDVEPGKIGGGDII